MKPKTHLLTFVVEDYFQSSALSSVISPRRWQRFEPRIEANTRRVMDLLDEYQTKATFFVLGWVADEMPQLVREIVARGHEVASKGYGRAAIRDMTPDEFRMDVRRSRQAIFEAAGVDIYGFRVGRGSLGCSDLWALNVLAEEGFCYDSSVYPQFRSIAKHPALRFPYVHRSGVHEILELPLSTFGRDEWLLRVAGGNYARQFPSVWMKQAFRFWHEHYVSPFNMYFHVWEFDANPPRITGASFASQIRQYRNLGKVPALLRYFLDHYAFGPIADVMEFREAAASLPARVDPPLETPQFIPRSRRAASTPNRGGRQSVTVVIPCYNEQPVLRYLDNALSELDDTLGQSFDIEFLFVDDGSVDETGVELSRLFGDRPNYRIVQHETNLGVAAATLTGIHHANTEIVCVMDADCTYDPHQLQSLLQMLTDSVDLVTASPYHPLGGVMNVPRWRLFLSRTASRCYRQLLKNKLFTYTSCFRAYRKSAVEEVQICDGGFLGITEILWQLDRNGSRIVECPAVLEVRILGTSKLKTLRGIISHLRLLTRIALNRQPKHPINSAIPLPSSSSNPTHEAPHGYSTDRSTPPHATV